MMQVAEFEKTTKTSEIFKTFINLSIIFLMDEEIDLLLNSTRCPRNNLTKRKLYIFIFFPFNMNVLSFLFDRAAFKVFFLFLFEIIMMRYPIESQIQVVVLMAKFDCSVTVIRESQPRGMTDIPIRQTMTSIYQKFLDIDSFQNVSLRRRPTAITEDKMNGMEQAFSIPLVNSVRNMTRQANISKNQAHQFMRDIVGFKPCILHCTQQLYDEDMDLCAEMAECWISILDKQANNGIIFFSDQSCFHVAGLVNKHNCRIWVNK